MSLAPERGLLRERAAAAMASALQCNAFNLWLLSLSIAARLKKRPDAGDPRENERGRPQSRKLRRSGLRRRQCKNVLRAMRYDAPVDGELTEN